MRFYGNGVVWDNELKKRLCKFENGMFETVDIHIVNELKKRNYTSAGVLEIPEDVKVYEPKIKEEVKVTVEEIKKPTKKVVKKKGTKK